MATTLLKVSITKCNLPEDKLGNSSFAFLPERYSRYFIPEPRLLHSFDQVGTFANKTLEPQFILILFRIRVNIIRL